MSQSHSLCLGECGREARCPAFGCNLVSSPDLLLGAPQCRRQGQAVSARLDHEASYSCPGLKGRHMAGPVTEDLPCASSVSYLEKQHCCSHFTDEEGEVKSSTQLVKILQCSSIALRVSPSTLPWVLLLFPCVFLSL